MKSSELRTMAPAAISDEIIALRREQFNLRMQLGTKQLTHTSNLGNVRRKIARAKTILHEKNRSKS